MKLLRYFSKYKKDAVLAPLLKLSEAILELLIPVLVANIIDKGVNGGDKAAVYIDVSLMLLLGVVGLAFSIAGQYFSARAATGFASELRGDLYDKLLNSPSKVTDKIGVAAMITRMTSDINQIQNGINLTLRLLLRSPCIVFGSLIAALLIDVKVGLIFVAVIILLALVVAVIMRISIPKYGKAQKELDSVSLTARENLTGVRVIRAFGIEDNETKEFERKTATQRKLQNSAARVSSLFNPLTFALVNLGVIALIYVGAIRVEEGALTQGRVVALYNYMVQILVELIKFADLAVVITRSLACGKRIQSVLNEKDEECAYESAKSSDYIKYDSVDVRYGGTEALIGVTFSVEKGETVGIIGGTGSGKSTLVNLLPRLYDVSGGSVSLCGKDLREYSPEVLREKIGIALQKPTIYKGTIKSNVLLGNKNATDEDIISALNIAQAGDIVAEKGGIYAEVEQGGRNFSGGQKQRIEIARAIVKKPEILILDDSSSALDYLTDLRLRKAIADLDYKPTVFIVSQRTASVKSADKIIVLENGRIVGIGTHEELMSSCGEYREIELSQQREGTL